MPVGRDPLGALLEAFAPNPCVECGEPLRPGGSRDGDAFCPPCAAALPIWRRSDGCPRCGTRREPGQSHSGCGGCLSEGHPLHACHVAYRYADPLARIIPALKRTDRPGPLPTSLLRAFEVLADTLAARLARDVGDGIDLVVPLPLHAQRLRQRGFNPASLLARPIGAQRATPVRADALSRTRATAPQAGLRGEARRANVRGAFRARKDVVSGRRVAVVDDVLTTGSTLEVAAEALLEAGALEVRGVALAATLPPRARRPRRRPFRAPPVRGPYPPRSPTTGPGLQRER